jgi:hypothetical protein
MQAKLTPASAKAAAAAGVKPAALVTRLASRTVPHDRAVPKPAFEMTESKLNPKAVSSEVRKPGTKTPVKSRTLKVRRTMRKAPAPKKAALRGKPARFAVAKASGIGPARSVAAQKPSAGKRALPIGITTPVPAATTVPKPSPAFAKQQGNQSPN